MWDCRCCKNMFTNYTHARTVLDKGFFDLAFSIKKEAEKEAKVVLSVNEKLILDIAPDTTKMVWYSLVLTSSYVSWIERTPRICYLKVLLHTEILKTLRFKVTYYFLIVVLLRHFQSLDLDKIQEMHGKRSQKRPASKTKIDTRAQNSGFSWKV